MKIGKIRHYFCEFRHFKRDTIDTVVGYTKLYGTEVIIIKD